MVELLFDYIESSIKPIYLYTKKTNEQEASTNNNASKVFTFHIKSVHQKALTILQQIADFIKGAQMNG
jgi:hypothetical protein